VTSASASHESADLADNSASARGLRRFLAITRGDFHPAENVAARLRQPDDASYLSDLCERQLRLSRPKDR